MKLLLVDDERLARVELRRLLRAHPDCEIVGEAANTQEARQALEKLFPDLMLLDVEMPGESGLAFLESLEHPPTVILTTAFRQYAVDAFDQSAIDYLLKPIEPERLARALDRVRAHLQKEDQETPRSTALQQFFVRDGERGWMVRTADLRLMESEGNYTRLYFGEHRPLVLRSLQALQERLGGQSFFRANRTQVVHVRWIDSVELNPDMSLTVILRDGTRINLSRRQSQLFRERLTL